jgi:hypothetical protein
LWGLRSSRSSKSQWDLVAGRVNNSIVSRNSLRERED